MASGVQISEGVLKPDGGGVLAEQAYTLTYGTAARTVPNATGAAVSLTATVDAPAGGTGATGGAYDTSGHRDTAIATINALRVDVTALIAANTALLADVLALKKVVVALVLDLQDKGLVS